VQRTQHYSREIVIFEVPARRSFFSEGGSPLAASLQHKRRSLSLQFPPNGKCAALRSM
jgi:hypothetical protein